MRELKIARGSIFWVRKLVLAEQDKSQEKKPVGKNLKRKVFAILRLPFVFLRHPFGLSLVPTVFLLYAVPVSRLKNVMAYTLTGMIALLGLMLASLSFLKGNLPMKSIQEEIRTISYETNAQLDVLEDTFDNLKERLTGDNLVLVFQERIQEAEKHPTHVREYLTEWTGGVPELVKIILSRGLTTAILLDEALVRLAYDILGRESGCIPQRTIETVLESRQTLMNIHRALAELRKRFYQLLRIHELLSWEFKLAMITAGVSIILAILTVPEYDDLSIIANYLAIPCLFSTFYTVLFSLKFLWRLTIS